MLDFHSVEGEGTTFFFTFEVESNQYHVLQANQTLLTINDDNSPRDSFEDNFEEEENNAPQSELLNNKILSLKDVFAFKRDRILVVDDEEFCLVSVKVMLKNLGFNVSYQVDFCINGLEALQTLKIAYQNQVEYCLIITDYHMPKMDGIEATSAMRNFLASEMNIDRERQPKIVGLTGHAIKEYHDKGIEAGMDSVLSKPIHIENLS